MPDSSHKFSKLSFVRPVYQGGLLEPEPVNQSLTREYQQAVDAGNCRQTHFFNGRFENTYIDVEKVPGLAPVTNMVRHYARQILDEDIDRLKCGFWFNAMQPGHDTSLHTHEEYEEKLSAVYYINAPEGSGDLLIHDRNDVIHIKPVAGQVILFGPEVPHEVELNQSNELRLSVAFNFGL